MDVSKYVSLAATSSTFPPVHSFPSPSLDFSVDVLRSSLGEEIRLDTERIKRESNSWREDVGMRGGYEQMVTFGKMNLVTRNAETVNSCSWVTFTHACLLIFVLKHQP